jgi:hypothetical protein
MANSVSNLSNDDNYRSSLIGECINYLATREALSSTAAFLLLECLFMYLGVKLKGWQYGV